MNHKIDGLNPLAGAAGRVPAAEVTRRSSGQEPVAAASPVKLSGDTVHLSELLSTSATAPDVDEARVASVRAALADGSYRIDPENIARRLLALEMQLPKT